MPYFVALFVVLMWGTTFVSSKVLLNSGLLPADIFFVRFVIAYLCMLCLSHKRLFANSIADELTLVGLGLMGGSIYFLVENMALLHSTASNVSILVSTTIGGAQRSVYPSPQSSWRCPRPRSIFHMGILLTLHAKDNGQILSRFHYEKGILLRSGDYPTLLCPCASSQHRASYLGQHDDMGQSDIPRIRSLYKRLSAMELGNAKAWSCEIN